MSTFKLILEALKAPKPENEPPGVMPIEGREFRYVQKPQRERFEQVFRKILQDNTPPFPEAGGVITEGCEISLPGGETFGGLSYNGDIAGWRFRIERGVAEAGLLLGEIKGEEFLLQDGRSFHLKDCLVRFS